MIRDSKAIQLVLEKLSYLTKMYALEHKLEEYIGVKSFSTLRGMPYSCLYLNIDSIYVSFSMKNGINNINMLSNTYLSDRNSFISEKFSDLFFIFLVYESIEDGRYESITNETFNLLNDIYERLSCSHMAEN